MTIKALVSNILHLVATNLMIVETWKQQRFTELKYYKPREPKTQNDDNDNTDFSPILSVWQHRHKNYKSSGSDDIPAEFLKVWW